MECQPPGVPSVAMFMVMRPTVPAIVPLVDSIWLYDERLPAVLEHVLPTGSMQLLVNLDDDVLATHGRGGQRTRGAALQAAHAGPVLIDTAQQRRILGVSFRPGGAHPFFAVPPGALDQQLVGLDDLWGRDGAVLRDRLLSAGDARSVLRAMESVLVSRLSGEPDPVVAFAVAAFERGLGVGAVAERLGVGRRRFTSDFTERVGLAPKRYARIRRFQRVLDALGAMGATETATTRTAATSAGATGTATSGTGATSAATFGAGVIAATGTATSGGATNSAAVSGVASISAAAKEMAAAGTGAADAARAGAAVFGGAAAGTGAAGTGAAGVAAVGVVDWAGVAVAHGFYDQSHLIRDFRAFAGTSPTGYRPRSGEARNHVPISPIVAVEREPMMAS